MANIITLTGPSHCGKSTIRQFFMGFSSEQFKPVMFKKYTTRAERKSDDDVVHVDQIPSYCDYVYEQYGVRYGFSFDELYSLLRKGQSPIIVINDVRAVEDLKSALGGQVVSIFLYRKAAVLEEFIAEEMERAADSDLAAIENNARIRFDKAKTIYRIYIENIHLFDHTVLNVADFEQTKIQVEHIVNKMTKAVEGLIEV